MERIKETAYSIWRSKNINLDGGRGRSCAGPSDEPFMVRVAKTSKFEREERRKRIDARRLKCMDKIDRERHEAGFDSSHHSHFHFHSSFHSLDFLQREKQEMEVSLKKEKRFLFLRIYLFTYIK